MVQIYFLLVLSNLFMGIILSKEFFKEKTNNFSQINEILSSEILQVSTGCIGAIVGILSLFLRFTGNLIILGDFIPSIIAILAGITLFIEYISQEENNDSKLILFFKETILKHRTILGFISMIFGLVHFIAPSIELL